MRLLILHAKTLEAGDVVYALNSDFEKEHPYRVTAVDHPNKTFTMEPMGDYDTMETTQTYGGGWDKVLVDVDGRPDHPKRDWFNPLVFKSAEEARAAQFYVQRKKDCCGGGCCS